VSRASSLRPIRNRATNSALLRNGIVEPVERISSPHVREQLGQKLLRQIRRAPPAPNKCVAPLSHSHSSGILTASDSISDSIRMTSNGAGNPVDVHSSFPRVRNVGVAKVRSGTVEYMWFVDIAMPSKATVRNIELNTSNRMCSSRRVGPTSGASVKIRAWFRERLESTRGSNSHHQGRWSDPLDVQIILLGPI